MIPQDLQCLLIIVSFCMYFLINVHTWNSNKKRHWKVDKIKSFASILALSSFLFLFTCSLIYRFRASEKIEKNTCIVGIADRIAESLHFGFDAMTSGLLTDKSNYTEELLNNFVYNEWHSPAYFFIIIGLVLAPLSTAAWLISVFDSNIGSSLKNVFLFMNPRIVFYSPSNRSIMLANHIENTFREKAFWNKPLLIFCRSAFNQENASLEKRAEIRRLRGIPVDFTERDYVYRDKDNTMILCADNLAEIYEFIPSHYIFPENIRRVFLISNEDSTEIKLVSNAVDNNKESIDKKMQNNRNLIVKTYSIWETFTKIAFEKIGLQDIQNPENGFIVGEGNILPVALKVMREELEKCLKKNDNHQTSERNSNTYIVAFPLQKEIYFKLKQENWIAEEGSCPVDVDIIEPNYSVNESPFDLISEYIDKSYPARSKWLLLVSENSGDNIRRKRLFCSKYKDKIEQEKLKIVVYCCNQLEILREQEWDNTYNVNHIIYVGDDRAAIKWIYENEIEEQILHSGA